MAYTLDNQALMYIIIALFVIQYLAMRYYVQTSIEEHKHKNNKKVIKKVTDQNSTTFDQYMGKNGSYQHDTGHNITPVSKRSIQRQRQRNDVDSIEDPAEDPAEDPVDDVEGEENLRNEDDE